MQELCRYLQHIYDRKIKIRYNYIALKSVYMLSGMMKRGSVSHYGDLLNVEFFANYVHPTRQFMRNWKEQGIDAKLAVFRVKNGVATTWSMATNFEKKEYINL